VKSRYGFLDALRGFAALWVLGCHSISADYTHLNCEGLFFGALTRFMEQGGLGVCLFFMISGYGISGSAERSLDSAWMFLKRRAAHIYPAYWVSIALCLIEVSLIVSLGAGHHAAIPSWQRIVAALPLLTTPNLARLNPVYWSLTYVVHFYILTAAAILLLRRRFFFLLDAFTLFVLANQFGWIQLGAWGTILVIQPYWFDFYCGALLYRMLKNTPNRLWAFYPRLLLMATIALTWRFPFRYHLSPLLTVALVLLHSADAWLCDLKLVAAFRQLGVWSYSLILTNVMVGPKLIGFVNRMTEMNNTLYLVILALGTAGSIAWAYVFYRWVERPLSRWAGSWQPPASSIGQENLAPTGISR
jgi:exopolysaccharide production protein ExoZ